MEGENYGKNDLFDGNDCCCFICKHAFIFYGKIITLDRFISKE